MTQPVQDKIWLTQEAYDKLQAELENLRGPVRQDIIARISAARDEGDLKENGGYHAAKEEQGKIEARIRQLEDIKRKAEVGEMPQDDGIVEPGMKVTSKVDGRGHDVPVGQQGPRRRHHRRLLPRVAAGLGHPRPQGRRQGVLHRADRQDDQGRDRRGQALLHRLSASRQEKTS